MSAIVADILSSLAKQGEETSQMSSRSAFASDPNRFARFHAQLDDLLFDYSKQNVTEPVIAKLIELAKAAKVEAKRDAMFSGAVVNPTEERAALHTALRDFAREPVRVNGVDVIPAVVDERGKMLAFAEDVRAGRVRGVDGRTFSDVVNIGIGGSDLGPAMATKALSPLAPAGLRPHFVSNVDGADIADTLAALDPHRTLFIVSSKTFTTQETMMNARSARAWIVAALGEAAVTHHFAAVSTRLDKVAEFGINPERVFGFWDWVGGRYSIWSSIGLALAIAIGADNYREFLRGGYDVDCHFRTASIGANIPMLMGLISVWNRNGLGRASQAVIPYDQRLSRFPAYLQQLQMESNGKRVTYNGAPVAADTGAIVWGEPGTNGQHAFFQLLHQGTEVCPIDFLVAALPTKADAHHHDLLVANCFAQGEALMKGRPTEEARTALLAQGVARAEVELLAAHKTFPGSRPSSTIVYRQLTPRTLGRLIAIYEHKVFVEAAIWDINPFDQWGVELGKELASRLAPIVEDANQDLSALDSSTAGLVAHIRALRQASK
ncbi:MAG: glucose-6-phosphate isomerase [Roseiarcus sp.]